MASFIMTSVSACPTVHVQARVSRNSTAQLPARAGRVHRTKLSTVCMAATGTQQEKLSLEQLESIPPTQVESFARQHYHDECEARLNDQINTEYNVSYIYHALYAYFNRDNVALPGLAQYYKDAAVEEREHAEMMMQYQNLRGGKVVLQSLVMPDIELSGTPQGDALYSMELALSLERLNNEKLLALHKVAEEFGDVQMTDYIEGTYLEDQVKAINDVSKYVSELRRVGAGHGTYRWDKDLLNEINAAAAALA